MLDRVLNKFGKPDVASCDSAGGEELVAAAKDGDEGAFKTLFHRHQRRIFALAFRYTRVREDAEGTLLPPGSCGERACCCWPKESPCDRSKRRR